MRRFNYLFIAITIGLAIFISGCQEQNEITSPDLSAFSAITEDESIILAQAIANAMQDEDVKEFIKKEALVKFDEDFDILFQMVKDKQVRDGKSFMNILIEHSNPNTDLNTIVSKIPLLTIFIPDLQNFSASSWDTKKDPTPFVALDMFANKDNGTIKLINNTGEIREEQLSIAPNYPVIVLKNNERVKLADNKIKENSSAGRNFVFENQNFAYSFIKDDFNKMENTARVGYYNNFDQRVQDAYTKGLGCSNCYHRDYIYYGISPTEGISEGSIDLSYSEAITAIYFANAATVQSISNSWTEGVLELHFNILFIGASSSLEQLEKVAFVNTNDLVTADKSGRVEYTFPTPIKITPWQMDVYGDKWKIIAFEYDPGSVVTVQSNHSSTKAGNFKVDLSGELFKLIKVGVGFGGSSTSTTSSATTIQTTLSSNALGEGILNWFDPVLIKKVNLGIKLGETNVVNTGAVSISIEPVK